MIDTPLIIRADAGAEIGIGHVMRCLALGQAWKDRGGHVVFVTASISPALRERLCVEGMEVQDLPMEAGSENDARETAETACVRGARWVVVDGYHFGAEYQRTIKGCGLNLLVIDDFGHAEHYMADIVLNQNLHAEAGMYANLEPYTRLLLGPRYVLLRREFQNWADWRRETVEVAHRILVTLGGGDEDNATLRVLHALPHVRCGDLEVVVVIGASNPHRDLLELKASNMGIPISVQTCVNNMPELMAWADVAVTAGGSTCWELAFMGLPAVVLVLAENQFSIANGLHQLSVIKNLGYHHEVSTSGIATALRELLADFPLRYRMFQNGRRVVDGRGATRVLMEMMVYGLRVRPVCKDDMKVLWEWANDPDVRKASFDGRPISWGDHVRWFASKYRDPNCRLYIIESADKPLGQVRFDIFEREAKISVSICNRMRGFGCGAAVIGLAVRRLLMDSSVNTVNAFIKPDNYPSIKAFKGACFERVGERTIGQEKALHYMMRMG